MLAKRYASAQDPDGVIDLERLRSGPPASMERDAAGFLELTCPSSDVHALVRGLSDRFNVGRRADRIDRTCRNTLGFPVPLPQPAAGALGVRSIYRHGGLTLMEMLAPWLVPEPATCTAGDRARGAKSKTLPGSGAEPRC